VIPYFIYTFAALIVLSVLYICFTKHLLRAVFALMLTFLAVSALYVLAGADFLAIAQIMIYVGGVLVLLVFGVMLTNRSADAKAILVGHTRTWLGGLLSVALFILFFTMILRLQATPIAWLQKAPMIQASTLEPLGMGLLTYYLLPLELAAVLLMVALIGAAFVAARK